jgi:threonine dehydrogenase-like Zn-dependent dehydrogenase
MLTVNPSQIHYNEITITGSIDATMDDFKRAAAMAPSLGLSRFVTHTFPLEKVKDGMETMRRKEGLKVILETGG